MNDQEPNVLLDRALASLASVTAFAPSPGFAARVMKRLENDAQQRFASLLSSSDVLSRQCAQVRDRAELVAWLQRTAQEHGLPLAPLLARVDRYFESANDAELDDAALDAVVGAGATGASYLEYVMRSLLSPR